MEISSSSSDEDYYFDEPFNSIFNRVFKKNELISDNSEDNFISENNINSSSNPHFIKDESNNNINEIKENENVSLKDKCKIFKIYKEEQYILFEPENCLEYYKKCNSTKLLFNTWKDKQSRKEKPDEIRKKIKSRFFNSLKNCINKLLDSKLIQKKFEFLPQSFISDIAKQKNKNMLEKTLEEIILENKEENSKKYENNKNLLTYLKEKDKNDLINNKKIRIYNIFNTTIKQLFNEYLTSKEFDKSILKLKEEGNYTEYIKEYINHAKDFVNFFSN